MKINLYSCCLDNRVMLLGTADACMCKRVWEFYVEKELSCVYMVQSCSILSCA
jgi:hypothetical protein